MEKKDKNSKEVARSESMPASPRRNIPSRSLTLPANSRLPPDIGRSVNSGFFTRLKRCLRIGSKGRYSFSTAHGKTPKATDAILAAGMQNLEQRPSQTLRQLRRSIPDKEEVVLLHKGPRIVDSSRGDNSRLLESVSEDTLVQIVGASQNNVCQSSCLDDVMSAEQHRDEDLAIDDLDEMDPGYETLDEVRKKVQMKLRASCHDDRSSELKHIPEENVEVRKHSAGQLSGQENGEKCMRDSGLATPLTDSPESYRESNAESVNSSMLSESTGIADESGIEVDMLDLDNINVFDHLNSASAYSIPSDSVESQQRHNSDSFLTNPCFEIEEELYANPKVISRKRSQKQQGSESEIATDNAHLSLTCLEQENVEASMPEKSVSEGDVSGKPWRGSSVESDKSAPPLPERKYTLTDNGLPLEEGSEPETPSVDVDECEKCVKIDSKIDVETSEESTLDAVSDCGDVLTDNEAETVCENTAIEAFDDGYQTIKNVQAQKMDSHPDPEAPKVDSSPDVQALKVDSNSDVRPQKVDTSPDLQDQKVDSSPDLQVLKVDSNSDELTLKVDSDLDVQALKNSNSEQLALDDGYQTIKDVQAQKMDSHPDPEAPKVDSSPDVQALKLIQIQMYRLRKLIQVQIYRL
ncbi:uncharacterized protein LOC121387069 [Gigantopelta aegis]|uniref:uncharacterized protein LOC121387069 n=1 Tax=Gigantopelta aegis TaxID=1735272 RepID=UPI001B88C33E|nr:uncharacterized protein LOC121387069 [Gigantopelta aegis]